MAHEDVPSYGSKEYWDQRFEEEESFEWLLSYEVLRDEGIIDMVCPEKTARILNIGCGNSQITEKMYDAGYHDIVNTDISEVVVEKMRARNAPSRPEMQWLVADVLKMDCFETGSFDVVLDKSTLDAVGCVSPDDGGNETVARMLAEVMRVLRPGGIYLLVTLNDTNPGFLRMPHLAFDVMQKTMMNGIVKNTICVCRKRAEADTVLQARLPGMLAWTAEVDSCVREGRPLPSLPPFPGPGPGQPVPAPGATPAAAAPAAAPAPAASPAGGGGGGGMAFLD